MARLHYIDNLRWMSILVLFPFHAAFIFCPGWYGYYVSSGYSSIAAHCLTVAVEPWIMPLLFGITGLSTKFALQERTHRVYLKERVTKLLLPFLAGLVLVCPVITYYALKFHTGYTGNFAGALPVRLCISSVRSRTRRVRSASREISASITSGLSSSCLNS